MTPERVEHLLRTQPVADEARFVPRALPASVADARVRLRGQGRPGVARFAAASAAAAAAMLAIALGSTWLGDGGGPFGGELPSGSTVPTAVPTSAASPTLERCTAADFAVSSDPWDAAAGSRGTRVVFRVVDSVDACTVAGSLDARIADGTGLVLVEGRSDPADEVTVTAGMQLEIGVSWSNWCGDDPSLPLAASVTLAGDDTAIPLVPPAGSEILVPPCMGSGQETVLNVTAFEPSTRLSPEG